MKIKTTKKAVKDNYNQIINIGYADAQYLLEFKKAFGYSSRAEGWACDYYDVNDVCISTGYSPIDNRNVKCNYELIRSYNEKAREIRHDNSMTWEQQAEKINQLLNDFVNEVTK